MVLELLSPSTFEALSPRTRVVQEELQAELTLMVQQFPDAKKRDLERFLMGNGQKAAKAAPAYEAHLKW